ncbi:MAG: DUF2306 domain-containing protein [Tagaea sp.]
MTPLIALHTAAASFAVVLGIFVLARPKGTPVHKAMGRVWVAAMATTAISSFWILRIRDGAGFSPIHILSVVTLVTLACAIWSIRRGNLRAHQINMLSAFAGTLIAGAFTLLPGRIIGGFLFGG